MNKKVLIMLFGISCNVFAGSAIEAGGYPSGNCEQITDVKEKRECLITEKRVQANKQFNTFSEGNKSAYQQNF